MATTSSMTVSVPLWRAADLIGQLGDPLYPRKLNALYHEFAETGINEALSSNPADLADRYPRFFWSKVEPFLPTAVHALRMTAEGRKNGLPTSMRMYASSNTAA